jgi:O-antigen/teichoic acid export membrane protein
VGREVTADRRRATGRRLSASSLVRRAGWSAVDQGLSSLSNVALGVLLARELTREAFGAYGLAFAAYALVLSATRGLVSSVLQIRFTAAEPSSQRGALRDSSGASLVVALAVAAPAVLLSRLVGGPVGVALLAMAVTLPGLLVQDSLRLALLTVGRARAAAANDLVWVALELPVLAVLLWQDSVSLGRAVTVWGGAACVAALVGVFQAGVVPSVRRGVGWLTTHRDLGLPMFAEFLLIAAVGPATLLLAGAVTDLREVAALRAAEVLLSPVNLLFGAAVLIVVPEAARVLSTRPDRLPRVLRTGGWAFATVAISFGLVVVLLPDGVGEAVVGDNWRPSRTVVLPLAFHAAATGLMTSWLAGLRVLEAARDALVVRVVLTPPYLVGALLGLVWSGAGGAAVAMAVVSVVGAELMRRRFAFRFSRRGAETPPPLPPADLPGPHVPPADVT